MHIHELKERLLEKTYYHWCGSVLFKSFGIKSYCINPIRVKGGNYIAIGNNVSILNFLRIEAYNKCGKDSSIIVIGDNSNIEQNVHITGAEKVSIGSNVSILGGVVITDIIHPYEDVCIPVAKQEIVTKPVEIGDECFLGMYSMIMPGVKLGKHVIVGAHSVVTRDVPDYCVVVGAPAQIIKKYDNDLKIWVNNID